MTTPSYEDVVAGLHGRFQTITAFAADPLDYEPNSLHTTPIMYSILDEETVTAQGQMIIKTYITLHRVCVARQDNERAEQLLRQFVDSVPDAIEQSPDLGGLLTSGIAEISRGRAGYARINQTVYRTIDFTSRVVVKRGRLPRV